MRNAFELMETTILADGREWVAGGEGVGMADIEGVFFFVFSRFLIFFPFSGCMMLDFEFGDG